MSAPAAVALVDEGPQGARHIRSSPSSTASQLAARLGQRAVARTAGADLAACSNRRKRPQDAWSADHGRSKTPSVEPSSTTMISSASDALVEHRAERLRQEGLVVIVGDQDRELQAKGGAPRSPAAVVGRTGQRPGAS